MNSIQVFCGSSSGKNPVYATIAQDLGYLLAEKGIDLVYGAGNVGLMGVLADAALEKNGTVIGVIPHFLMDKEVGHTGISELILVDSMHIRKVRMYERSEGTIVLPGGFGTLDELFEMLTLVQLGQQQHPIGILNAFGFFDPLLAQLDQMVKEQFLKPFHRAILLDAPDAESLISKMENYQTPEAQGKWWTDLPKEAK